MRACTQCLHELGGSQVTKLARLLVGTARQRTRTHAYTTHNKHAGRDSSSRITGHSQRVRGPTSTLSVLLMALQGICNKQCWLLVVVWRILLLLSPLRFSGTALEVIWSVHMPLNIKHVCSHAGGILASRKVSTLMRQKQHSNNLSLPARCSQILAQPGDPGPARLFLRKACSSQRQGLTYRSRFT